MVHRQKQQPIRAGHPTLIGSLIEIIFNLTLLALVSWVALVIWFNIKSQLSNNYQLSNHIQRIVNPDLSYIAIHHNDASKWIINLFNHIQLFFSLLLVHIGNCELARQFAVTIIGSFEIMVVRICIFILSIPIFTLFYFISIVDGLVQRDIRKFKCTRESSFFFHRIKPLSGVFTYALFVIYMAVPLQVSPEILLIPMVILSSYFIMLTIKSYKKYL